jgi:two-component system alkaline phosphatase synthesis response regulator PhoP
VSHRILIVDDEEDILHFLDLVLREKGYEVTTARTGRDGLAKARSERPSLVLLDIMMPEMDGWAVLRRLREDPVTALIPVAMLSARTDTRDRVQGLREGAVDYLCKPFSLQELTERVRAILARVEERRT